MSANCVLGEIELKWFYSLRPYSFCSLIQELLSFYNLLLIRSTRFLFSSNDVFNKASRFLITNMRSIGDELDGEAMSNHETSALPAPKCKTSRIQTLME